VGLLTIVLPIVVALLIHLIVKDPWRAVPVSTMMAFSFWLAIQIWFGCYRGVAFGHDALRYAAAALVSSLFVGLAWFALRKPRKG
jgi:hypothetical protein